MPKTKKQKISVIDNLDASFKSAKATVFANFQGLTVAESEELRNICRKENVTVKVVKKTLLKRVFADQNLIADPKLFDGGIVSLFGLNDEIAPAKILCDFAKTHKVVTVFGGTLEGKFIDAGYVKNLATLPTKHQLLGQLVGTLNAPVSGFVNVLAGNLRGLVSVLNNIKEAKA